MSVGRMGAVGCMAAGRARRGDVRPRRRAAGKDQALVPGDRPGDVHPRRRRQGDLALPAGTRDGWVLPNGDVLLAVTKNKDYPGGAAVEVTRDGKVVFEFKGTQSEVNTVQAVGDNVLLTEAGDKPRLLEVDRKGKIVVDVPLQAQTKDHHLQTRMARKLVNGDYLVPQLLDKVVREYTPEGKIVWEVKTPDMPFTAIRLDNGNTLINCTLGNLTIEVDKDGKTVWQLSNDDLPEKWMNDNCGGSGFPTATRSSRPTTPRRTRSS